MRTRQALKQKQEQQQVHKKEPKQKRTRNDNNQFDTQDQHEPPIKKQTKSEQKVEQNSINQEEQILSQLKKIMNQQRNVNNKQIETLFQSISISKQKQNHDLDLKTDILEKLQRECLVDIRNKYLHVNSPEEIVQNKLKLQTYELEDNLSDVDEASPFQAYTNAKVFLSFNKDESRRVQLSIPLSKMDYKNIFIRKPSIKDLIMQWDYMHYKKELESLSAAVEELQSEYKDFGSKNQGKLIRLEIDSIKRISGFQTKGRQQRTISISDEQITQIQLNVYAFKRLRRLTISLYTCQVTEQLDLNLQKFISNLPVTLIQLKSFTFYSQSNHPLIIQTLDMFETNERNSKERSEVLQYLLLHFCEQTSESTKFERKVIIQSSKTDDWFAQFQYLIKTPSNESYQKQFKENYVEFLDFYGRRAPYIVEFKLVQNFDQHIISNDMLKIIQGCKILKVLHIKGSAKKITEAYPDLQKFTDLKEIDIWLMMVDGGKQPTTIEQINNETLELHLRNLKQLVLQKQLIFKFRISYSNVQSVCHQFDIYLPTFIGFEINLVSQCTLLSILKILTIAVQEMNIKSLNVKVLGGFVDEQAHKQFFDVLSEIITIAPQKINLELQYYHNNIVQESNERIIAFFWSVGKNCQNFQLSTVRVSPTMIQKIMHSWIQTLVMLKGPDRIELSFGNKAWSTLPYHKLQMYLQECVNAHTEIELDLSVNNFDGFRLNNPQDQILRWKESFLQQVNFKHMIKQQRINKMICGWRNGAIAEIVKEVKDENGQKSIPLQFLNEMLGCYYQKNIEEKK